MWINCKIVSSNFLLYNKFKEFINQTPFFFLVEENMDFSEDDQVIFWDIDSININVSYFKEQIDKGSVIIVISALLSKSMISNLFEYDHAKIGTLNKNIPYPEFLEEISKIVDEL